MDVTGYIYIYTFVNTHTHTIYMQNVINLRGMGEVGGEKWKLNKSSAQICNSQK